MKELLKNRDARLVWFSRTFSRFGDSFESLALIYLIYELTESALAMGTIMLFSVIPNIIVSPIAGVIGDRYNKKTIMIIAEIARAVTILIIPILHFSGNLRIWHIYIISVIVSIAESFFEPCAQVVMTVVVRKDQLPLYNSAITTSNHIARMLGYTLSGIVMSFLNKDVLFIVDAITFACSAITLLYITLPKVEIKKIEKKSDILIDICEVFEYAISTRIIPIILLTIILNGMLIVPITEFLPMVTDKIFNADATLSGYLMTILAIGSLLGSIIYPRLTKTKLKLKQVLFFGHVLIGVSLILMVLNTNIITGIIVYVILGITCSVITMWCSTEMQYVCKVEYMARTSSLFSMALTMSDPLSAAVSGWLIDSLAIKNVFLGTGILFISLGVILYLFIKMAYEKNVKNLIENENAINE